MLIIYNHTKIDMLFLEKFKNIVEMEKVVAANVGDMNVLREAKRMGFSDKFIGQLWNKSEAEMFQMRKAEKTLAIKGF